MQNNPQISFYYFFNLAKDQIQKQISEIENCFWINDVFHHTGYDNLCFVYKNNAFSVLIDITDENGTSYLPEDKKNQQILAAEKYNLIPCIFTIVVPDIKNFNNVEQIKPKTNGWNLVNTETKEQIISVGLNLWIISFIRMKLHNMKNTRKLLQIKSIKHLLKNTE